MMQILYLLLLYGILIVVKYTKEDKISLVRDFIVAFSIVGAYYAFNYNYNMEVYRVVQTIVFLTFAFRAFPIKEIFEVIELNQGDFNQCKSEYIYLGMISYIYYIVPLYILGTNSPGRLFLYSLGAFLFIPELKYLQIKFRIWALYEGYVYVFNKRIDLRKINYELLIVKIPIILLFIAWGTSI